jgi:hypothetical protein
MTRYAGANSDRATYLRPLQNLGFNSDVFLSVATSFYQTSFLPV